MPKQIKQMKISVARNQGKTHAGSCTAGGGVDGATNAVLNRHQLGIKLLFFVIVFATASWQRDNLFLCD